MKKILFCLSAIWVLTVIALFSFIYFNKRDPELIRQRGVSERHVDNHIDIIVLNYNGQQGSGIKAIISFQCWEAHSALPGSVHIVEPALSNSILTGDIVGSTFTFGDLFDLNKFNLISKKLDYAEMITADQFFNNGSKKIIFVETNKKNRTDGILWPKTNATDDCYPFQIPKFPILRRLHNRGYCIVKVVSIDYRLLTMEMMESILGRWKNKKVTLIFSLWIAGWYIKENEEYCKTVSSNISNYQHPFYPSERLLIDAEHYKERYLKSSKLSITVMMRIEHAIHFSAKVPIEKCMDDLIETTRRVQGNGSGEIPAVTMDIGKYGSSTWNLDTQRRNKIEKLAKNTLQKLLRGEYNYETWEESYVNVTGGVTNPGYTAALQRTIASKADCLILLGGGHFQQLALVDYLRAHQNGPTCIHLVCVYDRNHAARIVKKYSRKLDSY